MNPVWRITGAVIFCVLVLMAPVFGAQPSQVVIQLQSSIISIMKDAHSLDYESRYRLFEPLVKKSHDLPFVARVTAGRHWKSFNKDQKATFVRSFAKLSISTYAHRFDGYNGETFSFVSEKPLPRGKILVETIFAKSDGDTLQFNYLLRPVKDEWRIINVIVDGISDLALKRAEYTSVIEKGGFSVLIDKLEDQAKRYANSH